MRYFEDFAVGDRFAVGAFRLRDEEIRAYAGKYDPQPNHAGEAAGDSVGAVASGLHLLVIMLMLMNESFQDVPMEGSPGWDEIRWYRPARAGNVLSVECELLETRPSRSRPDIGIMRGRFTMSNQAGEQVVSAAPIWFVHRRPE